MEIILLERVGKLGGLGDIVTVKDGFARNFLLPQQKALRATPANLKRFEADRADIERRNAQRKSAADDAAASIDGKSFVIIRQAGDTGQLYGSVSTRDIADVVSATGAKLTRNQVVLDKAIKVLGLHEIRINLHAEVSVAITINVARTPEEAERQAKGEDVTADQFEDDVEDGEAISAQEVFDDEEVARQVSEELAQDEAQDETAPDDGEAAAQAAGPDQETPHEGDGEAAGEKT